MARLGPWDPARRVAVAVSGGADSLALALLVAGWGDPLALIVDHGLRPASAQEARETAARLAATGISARLLTLHGIAPGAGVPARARAARYAALEGAAAGAGLVDLLLGHHALDQAETVLMRARRGSGPAGLAGMAFVTEGLEIRRVRPLLALSPARLRATVEAAGLDWIDDPSNRDAAYTRTRLRAEIGGEGDALCAAASARAAARADHDRATAAELAERATLRPEGYAIVTPGKLAPASLARLIRAVSGGAFPPAPAAVAALAADLRPATLGGVEIRHAGRFGPGWLLVREAAAMSPPVPLAARALWDGRFRAGGAPAPGRTLGALGGGAAQFRGGNHPTAALRTLPAIRCGDVLKQVPALEFSAPGENALEIISGHFASPACGAPFMG